MESSDSTTLFVPVVSTHHSHEMGAFTKAMCKAQSVMRHAEKNTKNQHFKSSYADLSAVIDAIRDPLSSNDIAYIQYTQIDAHGETILVTWFVHISEQWVKGHMRLAQDKPGLQSFGSALTYAKRYSLMTMAGIAAEEDDDDGERASNRRPVDESSKAARLDAATKPHDAACDNHMAEIRNATNAAELNEIRKRVATSGIVGAQRTALGNAWTLRFKELSG